MSVNQVPEKTAAAGERRRQPGRLSERLSKKILLDTGIHTDPGTFSRTYAGRWQKAMGAFLWTMNDKDGLITVGSCDRASDCVRPGVKLSAFYDGFCTIEIIADVVGK